MEPNQRKRGEGMKRYWRENPKAAEHRRKISDAMLRKWAELKRLQKLGKEKELNGSGASGSGD